MQVPALASVSFHLILYSLQVEEQMQVPAVAYISFHLYLTVWGVEPVVHLHQCTQGLVENGCVAERNCLHRTLNAGSVLICCVDIGKKAFGSCAAQVHLVEGGFQVKVNPISDTCGSEAVDSEGYLESPSWLSCLSNLIILKGN